MGELLGAVLITGAATRLGAAMVRAVARDGFDVAIHCHRSLVEAQALAAEIAALGRRATVVRADLGNEAEVIEVVEAVVREIGPLAVLVNNASVFELDRLATADRSSWDRHLEVNLRAPIVLSQGFAAQLPRDRHGLIVNMLDQRVLNLTPNYLSYSISRMGLWGATQVLARELAPRVRVNAIGPGPRPALTRARCGTLRRAVPGHAAAARHQPGGDRGRLVLHHGQPVDDRPAAHASTAASRLGWLTPGAPQVD